MMARALTIAGSDSGGGAGIQADLKTFTVHRVFGMSAITALTAQNTCGVTAVHVVPPEFVRAQIDAVISDIGTQATKTGMLANAALVRCVAAAVREYRLAPLVVDPVMLAQSGAALLDADAQRVLCDELLPLATLLTPNVPEAEALTGMRIHGPEDMERAAERLRIYGASAVLIKGGHLDGEESVDLFDDGSDKLWLRTRRIATRHTHGTGCQLSAAITANLANGATLRAAVEAAKRFITCAIEHGLDIGQGCGPANPLAWLG
jgi:hydroxymethylpyrimidine/phosphomethylpyrimidine kinase